MEVPDLLAIPQAAERLGVSTRTVEELLRRCDLDAVRLPGVRRTLIRAESVAALIERSTERAIHLSARGPSRTGRRRPA